MDVESSPPTPRHCATAVAISPGEAMIGVPTVTGSVFVSASAMLLMVSCQAESCSYVQWVTVKLTSRSKQIAARASIAVWKAEVSYGGKWFGLGGGSMCSILTFMRSTSSREGHHVPGRQPAEHLRVDRESETPKSNHLHRCRQRLRPRQAKRALRATRLGGSGTGFQTATWDTLLNPVPT